MLHNISGVSLRLLETLMKYVFFPFEIFCRLRLHYLPVRIAEKLVTWLLLWNTLLLLILFTLIILFVSAIIKLLILLVVTIFIVILIIIFF